MKCKFLTKQNILINLYNKLVVSCTRKFLFNTSKTILVNFSQFFVNYRVHTFYEICPPMDIPQYTHASTVIAQTQ